MQDNFDARVEQTPGETSHIADNVAGQSPSSYSYGQKSNVVTGQNRLSKGKLAWGVSWRMLLWLVLVGLIAGSVSGFAAGFILYRGKEGSLIYNT